MYCFMRKCKGSNVVQIINFLSRVDTIYPHSSSFNSYGNRFIHFYFSILEYINLYLSIWVTYKYVSNLFSTIHEIRAIFWYDLGMLKVHIRKAFLNIAIIIRSISTCVRKISLVRFMNLLSSPMFISRFYPSILDNDIEYVKYNNMYF